MDKGNLFSISEFARLSGISRDNLIFYDKIGLLKPERVGRNGYRRYGVQQLGTAYLVMTFKELGMPLKKIKTVSGSRTPESILRTFAEQKAAIRHEVARMRQRLLMIQAYEDSIREIGDLDEGAIEVRTMRAESVFRGPVIADFHHDRFNDHIATFLNYCVQKGLSFGFPLGCEVTAGSLARKDWERIHRFYFRMPGSNQKKAAGLYAIGYSRGDYNANYHLYDRLTEYIAEKGMTIAGNAFEEYMLDEISTADPSEYLMRLSIRVQR